MVKYILITGGVVSSIGKGVVTSSLGYVLKEMGFSVTCIKIDPYLNYDAGTMSPEEHGEVFVLHDGAEGDLDLGNYERSVDIRLTKDHNITSGKLFKHLFDKERRGDFLGKTVQLIPHATNFIKEWIYKTAEKPVDSGGKTPEICLIELGGTSGDLESQTFFEALRQMRFEHGSENFAHIHVTFIPTLTISGEPKTKPTQQSILLLRRLGLNADIIICRSKLPMVENCRDKISLFGMVPHDRVLSFPDAKSIYEVPVQFCRLNVANMLLEMLKTQPKNDVSCGLELAKKGLLFQKRKQTLPKVKIAMIIKYRKQNADCYLSLEKALEDSAMALNINLQVLRIQADEFDINSPIDFVDGILIPGGFGTRSIAGKILSANFARTNDVPFLGICLGMQVAVMEFAKKDLQTAWGSEEFSGSLNESLNEKKNGKSNGYAIINMAELNKKQMGGTMRLGAQRTHLKKGSLMSQIYGGKEIIEVRFRHRYEVNLEVVPAMEAAGFCFTARDDSGKRMSAFEYGRNAFHVGVQFHPEFTSNPRRPSPVVKAFLEAALVKSRSLVKKVKLGC